MINSYICLAMYFSFSLKVLQCVCVTLVDSTNTGFVNRTQAEYNCRQHGGLYKVKPYQLRAYIADITVGTANFQNGQSAWINGYAQLSSHFLSYYGCYSGPGPSHNLYAHNINACVEYCRSFTFIGMDNRMCFCVSRNGPVNLKPLPDSNCNYKEYQSMNRYDSFISVYRVSNYDILHFNETEENRQCLVGRLEYETPRYSTKSCYTKSDDVLGYICTNSAAGPMTIDQCSSSEACVINNVTDWWTAREQCLKHNGKLLPYLPPDHTSTNTYWLGRFRSFKIVDDETTACLSVTRFESKLIVEPDNCSIKKMALCVNGLINIHEQTEPTTVSTEPAETSTPGGSITINTDNIDTTSYDEMSSSTCITYTSKTTVNNNHRMTVYITGLYVSVAFNVVFLVIIICICCRRLRKTNRQNKLNMTNTVSVLDQEEDTIYI